MVIYPAIRHWKFLAGSNAEAIQGQDLEDRLADLSVQGRYIRNTI